MSWFVGPAWGAMARFQDGELVQQARESGGPNSPQPGENEIAHSLTEIVKTGSFL